MSYKNIYMLCTLYFSYKYAINIKLFSLCALLSDLCNFNNSIKSNYVITMHN